MGILMQKEKKPKAVQKKTNDSEASLSDYAETLANLKHQIQEAQLKAALSVNRELILLYWRIGSSIIEKQLSSGWGTKVVNRLANDLRSAFPQMKGFSLSNVKYMVKFAKEYPGFPIGQQVVGQIPWGHNMLLLDKLKSNQERIWYAKKTIENGWSRAILTVWIENDLYHREGKAITNFKDTLPMPQSDLAQQVTKDPYVFDFLSMDDKFRERELEQGLIDHIQKLLMEFGRGFAFIGRQCELIIDGKGFLVDLLFYHVALHAYVVVELKTVEFEPEFAGKMNFYLGAVDRLLKKENDNPTIGLILCKSKSKLQVEVALQDINKPIGVSDYILAIDKGVPKELVSSLPTIEEIEAELSNDNQ
jgi:predicted nuclease of restriction endonuclease-like (RecB) superfamily